MWRNLARTIDVAYEVINALLEIIDRGWATLSPAVDGVVLDHVNNWSKKANRSHGILLRSLRVWASGNVAGAARAAVYV